MVLEKPATKKKLAKIEQLKIDSDHLVRPLKEVRQEVVQLSHWDQLPACHGQGMALLCAESSSLVLSDGIENRAAK